MKTKLYNYQDYPLSSSKIVNLKKSFKEELDVDLEIENRNGTVQLMFTYEEKQYELRNIIDIFLLSIEKKKSNNCIIKTNNISIIHRPFPDHTPRTLTITKERIYTKELGKEKPKSSLPNTPKHYGDGNKMDAIQIFTLLYGDRTDLDPIESAYLFQIIKYTYRIDLKDEKGSDAQKIADYAKLLNEHQKWKKNNT